MNNKYVFLSCWLDFEESEPHQFISSIIDMGFTLVEKDNDLQIWQKNDIPSIFFELLKVDSTPIEPVSKFVITNSEKIDLERRSICVPKGLDPYYRLLIIRNNETDVLGLYENYIQLLNEVFNKLNIRYSWQNE